MGGLTTLPEQVVNLLLVMVVDFAIPTVGFTTGLEAFVSYTNKQYFVVVAGVW